jgi:hypothetical protein
MGVQTGFSGPSDDLPSPEEFTVILDDQPLLPVPDELALEADPADALDQLRPVDEEPDDERP